MSDKPRGIVIVERTIQEVYYFDPKDADDCAVSAHLQQMIINDYADGEVGSGVINGARPQEPPPELGKYAIKAAVVPELVLLGRQASARWERMTKLTMVEETASHRPIHQWVFGFDKLGRPKVESKPVR